MFMQKNVILSFFFACLTCVVHAQKPNNPFTTNQPLEWSGTGWALNNGYVVTNHHVANNARTIKVNIVQGDSLVGYIGEVAAMDEEYDLAIIKIIDPKFMGFGQLPYSLKTALADVGETVFVLGFPLVTTMGDEIKLTTGIVSSHSGYEGNKCQYQISAPVQPGNSGGPLFDENGNVIGIVNAKHSGAENVSYAIKAEHLTALINQLPEKNAVLPTHNIISGLSLPQKVKQIKGYVCFIYCSSRGETPRSAMPKYGASTIPAGEKVIERPYVDLTRSENTRINKVIITDKETIIELVINNEMRNGYAQYMSINENTTLEVGDKEYKLIKAEGIAIAPDKTYFSKKGETKTFRLYFRAIPKSTTSINVVEPGDSDWKFYGILLKEY